MGFLDDLKNNAKSEKGDEALRNDLSKYIPWLADELTNDLLKKIKQNIQTKAIAGEYKVINGKKSITDTIDVIGTRYSSIDHCSSYFEYKKVLKKCQAAKIDVSDLCDLKEYDRYWLVESLTPVWKSKVYKRLTFGQFFWGIMTGGIFFLFALFFTCDSRLLEGRICQGTIGFDELGTQFYKMLEEKMRAENIIIHEYKLITSDSEGRCKSCIIESIGDNSVETVGTSGRIYDVKGTRVNDGSGCHVKLELKYEVIF